MTFIFVSAFTIYELPIENNTFLVAASKEYADLEKKYQQLQRQNGTLQSQVQEKEQKLQKLRTGSCNYIYIHIISINVEIFKIYLKTNL